MKVEVWSDIMCPFCYIGKRRFEAGLEQFGHKEEVEVSYRSFQLDPNAPVHADYDVHDMLAKKYGMSRDQAIGMNDQVRRQAEEVGLVYRFDTMVMTNTLDAHRLIQWAALSGKDTEVAELLFKAYFTDSQHVGDREVLASIAEQAGLNRTDAAAMLATDQFADRVAMDGQDGARLGVRGVPFYVIDNKYAVSGAQPASVFAGALEKAWSERKPSLTVINGAGGEADDANCSDGSCTVDHANKPGRS